MRKHRLRNKLKSIVGSHIDPDKDEELKGSNIETENKYEKILELLKEEDQDNKSKLVGLIEEFHKRYQSIYDRYDNITGKLKEKLQSKKEKDSFSSSSSDSDSDDSSYEKGSKNGKSKKEMYLIADSIKEELQAANTEIDELKKKLAIETEEKEALNSKCEAALNKIQETEKMFNESKLQADLLHEEKSKLLAANRDLNSKLESARLVETELNQKIEDINREKTSLMLEKETAMTTIEEQKRINEELRSILIQLKGEKEGYELELEGVKSESSIMKEKLKATEEEVSNLIQKIETSELENKSLSEKVLELSEEIKTECNKVQELSVECRELREKMADKENEFSMHTEMHELFKKEAEIKMRGIEELESLRFLKTEIEKQKEEDILALQKKSEEKETEFQSQINNLTEKIINLQKELESISTQKQESDNQLVRGSLEIADYLIQVRDLEQELNSLRNVKIELETEVNKRTREVSEYLIQIERLTEELANKNVDQEKMLKEEEVYKSKMKDFESKLKSSAEEIEIGIKSKEQIFDQLEETIEDLRGDLEIKEDEVNTLTETVRNLEVKIRLANQKLRVTEQMLNEAEHDHAMKEEKLHQEIKSLMNKISTLSETIAANKREVQDKVQETLTGFDSLTVKFEEDYGHVTTRVYEITNEVQAVQIHAKQNHSEKDALKRKVEETVMKLKVSEGENERLMKSLENMKRVALGKDKKIKELESTILVKEEGISGISEDKREAIKQLCIWADYHRDRCDHLQELLKTTTGGQRQTVRR